MAKKLLTWIDAWAGTRPADDLLPPRVDWLRIVPFLVLHACVLFVFVVGVSWTAVIVCVLLYALRMFGLTAGYHRYFAHRAYKTSRPGQFLLALLGSTAVQRGPLWWSAHHREHHRVSDEPADPHSPVRHGFLWSHMGWFTSRSNLRTRVEHVPDWARFPELVWLDRFTFIPVLALAALTYGLGALLERVAPGLNTNGPQLLVWGFVVSTVVLYQGTFTINSLAHRWGRRRYATSDDSRNNLVLALITLGEGWHNNHHHYPAAVRQGFYWWEIDLSWYALRGFAALGLIWDLKSLPAGLREEGRVADSPSGSRGAGGRDATPSDALRRAPAPRAPKAAR